MYGWTWLDPAMGLVGAVLVSLWAKGLLIETGTVLLDREMDHAVVQEIREVVEELQPAGSTCLTDLHVWRVGKNAYSCAMSLATDNPSMTPALLRQRLAVHDEIVHSTIEIHHLTDQQNLASLTGTIELPPTTPTCLSSIGCRRWLRES